MEKKYRERESRGICFAKGELTGRVIYETSYSVKRVYLFRVLRKKLRERTILKFAGIVSRRFCKMK